MSQYHKILNPNTIAIVGASDRPESVGYALIKNMENPLFKGKVFCINERKQTVLGYQCYPNVSSTPEKVDLAVIAIPAKSVPAVVEQCGKAGVSGLIIISAGFAEAGEEGLKMCDEIVKHCNTYQMRLIGPNCLGIINPSAGVNVSFAAITPGPGKIAFVSQSGALCTAILDWAKQQDVGFRYFVSIGSTINTDYADLFEYFETDPDVNSVLVYCESIKEPQRFIETATKFTKKRPIFILKAGKSEEGAAAAMSHTGSLAGNDAVYDAIFEKCGCIRVESINDLWDTAHVLSKQTLPTSNRLCIVTNAGGPGVISTDCLVQNGATLAKLTEETMNKLNSILSKYWSHGNPVDVLGDATPVIYQKTIDICIEDPNVDGVVVILTPQAMTDPLKCAEEVVKKKYSKPVLTSWMGDHMVSSGVQVLEKGGIPNFETPERAIKAFCNIMRHTKIIERFNEPLIQLEGLIEPDKEGARSIIEKVRSEGRCVLDEYEGKLLFSKYGIKVAQNGSAQSADDAVRIANECGLPVVLKILSPDILHKTEVGGVRVNVKTEEDVRRVYDELLASVKEKRPEAKIHGVLVEKMCSIKTELIIGCTKDPLFGPVILFGSGGILVELFKDSALVVPPVTVNEVGRLIDKTKISKVLYGFRGMKGYDVDGLKRLLVQFERLIRDWEEIEEVDINPLAGNEDGFVVLDSMIVLKKV